MFPTGHVPLRGYQRYVSAVVAQCRPIVNPWAAPPLLSPCVDGDVSWCNFCEAAVEVACVVDGARRSPPVWSYYVA